MIKKILVANRGEIALRVINSEGAMLLTVRVQLLAFLKVCIGNLIEMICNKPMMIN